MSEPTKEDLQAVTDIFQSYDLQRGYDDIDWRDLLEDVIPRFAQLLADQQINNQGDVERLAREAAEKIGDISSKVIRGTYSFDTDVATAIICGGQRTRGRYVCKTL